MTLLDVCNPFTLTSNSDVDEILLHYDGFIRMLARKYISHTITSEEVIDLDIDDLVQITRIKLWFALQKQEIRNMRAFIRRVVHNEAITMVRQHKPVVSLITNEEGEPYYAHVMLASGQEIQDPAEEIEQEEMLQYYSCTLTAEVPKLPPQQQRAMICSLKDQVSDLLPLVEMFLPYGIDVENIDWPEAESELQSTRSSLSVARRKLCVAKNAAVFDASI